jgi:hypothetical protein
MLITASMAFATFWLAFEARKTRKRADERADELAFRGALLEVAENLRALRDWQPRYGGRPPPGWTKERLTFQQLRDLLTRTWLHPRLWARLTGLIPYLTEQDRRLRHFADQANPHKVLRLYHLIDLYLQHVARGIVWQMERYHLKTAEARALLGHPPFDVLPWVYEELDQPPPEPHSIPPEPDEEDFRPARLTALAAQAKRAEETALEMLRQVIHGSFS